MVDMEIREGWVLVQAPKCLLVLSREEFTAALKRGKAWRRSQAMAARLGAQETGRRSACQPRSDDGAHR